MNQPMQKLGDLCSLITDGKHGDCRNEEGSGFFFISAKDVREGKIHYTDARQILESDFNETHRRTDLQPGDVMITNSGTIGRLAVADDDEITRRTTFQKSVAVLKPIREKILPRYLYYALEYNKKALINASGGAAQKNLLLGDLKRFEIGVPKISDQRNLCDHLETYDKLIENNKRRLELLEESARQLYKEWFVRFRFPGHEHVKIIDGIPEGWKKTTLGAVSVTNALSHKAKELPEEIHYIDISSVSTGRIETKSRMPAEEAPGRARRIAQHGDVIWSNVRPNLKAYALVLHPENEDVFSTGFTVISGMSIPYSFLYNFTTTDNFVSHLVNHTTGASYPAVRPQDFERAELLLPPRPLLDQFQEYCEPNYELAYILAEQSSQLAAARDVLLPKLMNGEIAV